MCCSIAYCLHNQSYCPFFTIKISYTSEPFAYEDEARRRLEYDKLMAILFDGGDPGEAAELGLRP